MATQSESKGKPENAHDEDLKDTQETETKQVAPDQGDDTPDLDSLLELLHGDVTEAESEDAIAEIDNWVNFLKGHKEDNIKEVSTHLKELKKLLKGKRTEPEQLMEVLSQLGEATNAVGDEAERGVKGPLHKVGKALIQASHKIEKVAEKADKGSETK